MFGKAARIALLLGVGILAFASLAVAKGKTINLRNDVLLPDGQTLKAGEYEVVVDEKVDQVQFLQHSVVVVKHRCKCVLQEKKNPIEAVLTVPGPANKPLLQEIRLKGETRIITLPS